MPSASRAVLGRLGTRNGLTPGVVGIDMSFSPSLAITAARIDKLGLNIKSFKEPLQRAIKQVMIPSFKANFAAGGRPDRWDPLSEGTLEIRERLGSIVGAGVLVKTGKLSKVMQQQNIWRVTNTTAIITDLPQQVWYGAIHQAGYDGGSMKSRLKKHGGDAGEALRSLLDDQKAAMRSGGTMKTKGAPAIPARPFALFQDEDEDRIAEVFIKWMQERIDRVWPARVIS
jgi:phage gpG-like protein